MHAPPFEFLHDTFLPLIGKLGPQVNLELERYGFYPPGGGRLRLTVEPATRLNQIEINEPLEPDAVRARALVVRLPEHIGERELNVVRKHLDLNEANLSIETATNAVSPGNVLTISVESDQLTEVITGIGQRGVSAETVAENAVKEATNYLETGAPVGEHLADQLLIPMGLAGGGSYTTGPLSLHTTTNINIVKKFLNVKVATAQLKDRIFRIDISSR